MQGVTMKMKMGFGFPCSNLRGTYRIFRRALKLKGEADTGIIYTSG
jgi:hypothetical protein